MYAILLALHINVQSGDELAGGACHHNNLHQHCAEWMTWLLVQLLAAFDRVRRKALGELEPPPIVLRGGYLGTHAPPSRGSSSASDLSKLSIAEFADASPSSGVAPSGRSNRLDRQDVRLDGQDADEFLDEAIPAEFSAQEAEASPSNKAEPDLMGQLDAKGFFDDADDDSFADELGLGDHSENRPTRGRKKSRSVGRRRHLPRNAKGR